MLIDLKNIRYKVVKKNLKKILKEYGDNKLLPYYIFFNMLYDESVYKQDLIYTINTIDEEVKKYG